MVGRISHFGVRCDCLGHGDLILIVDCPSVLAVLNDLAAFGQSDVEFRIRCALGHLERERPFESRRILRSDTQFGSIADDRIGPDARIAELVAERRVTGLVGFVSEELVVFGDCVRLRPSFCGVVEPSDSGARFVV